MSQTLPKSTDNIQDSLKPQARRKFKPMLLIPIGVAIAGISYATWQLLPKPEATALRLSGRIEADETDIGAKTGGRVSTIAVREGDQVQKDQVIAEITDEEVPEQLRAATADIQAARQEEQQARQEVAVADSRIRESQLNLQQSKGDATGRISQASSTVSAANAQLAQSQAQVKQAEADLKQAEAQLRLDIKTRDRYAQLVADGAINQQQFDQAQTTVETTQAKIETAKATLLSRQAAVAAARDQLSAAQGGLTQVQTTGLNPDIRSAQLAGFYQQRDQASAKLAAAQAKVRNKIAAQQQLQKRLDSFTIKSPIAGVVTARPVEPGAVVATGKTLLTVIDLNSVYLRGYVPEGEIGKIRVGQSASVFLDSNPDQPLAAKVAAIDPKASFTPENIYFRNDRVKQVFGIKVTIDNPNGFAKPGMPADAEVKLNGE
ncbi:HlyD family secretion protein [Phormidesmis sp. 146-33]